VVPLRARSLPIGMQMTSKPDKASAEICIEAISAGLEHRTAGTSPILQGAGPLFVFHPIRITAREVTLP
jgi:hypothetical protein